MQQALQQVEQATHAILRRRGSARVVISCPVSLVDHWLAPVVARFGAMHPEISVTIHGRVWEDEPPEIADIILSNVLEEDLGRAALPLWREELLIVCAPDLAVEDPSVLAEARLIHSLGRSEVWAQVFARLGLAVAAADPGRAGSCQANTFSAGWRWRRRAMAMLWCQKPMRRQGLRRGGWWRLSTKSGPVLGSAPFRTAAC